MSRQTQERREVINRTDYPIIYILMIMVVAMFYLLWKRGFRNDLSW